jgi:hypothetical protein
MSFLPNNYNSALMPMPLTPYERHMQKAARDFQKLQKVAAASDPTPRERAETIGKVLQSGMLRPGSGYLQKRAKERRFPIEHDDEEKHRLNVAVGGALAKQPGHSFRPGMSRALAKIASPGVGVGVRKMVAENNANLLPLNSRLPGQQGPTISEDVLEIYNTLPDGRLRQGVLNALIGGRPPASPNDQYRWAQSIVETAKQVRQMCDDMGLDASALLDALSRRLDFFDPMVSSRPSRPTPRADSISPNIDEPEAWMSDTIPPEEPMAVDDFAGSDRTDTNPDFSNKSVLAKFYKVGRSFGQDICKTPTQREMLEDHAKVVLKSDFPSGLRSQILELHAARNRTPHAEWAKVQRTPIYRGIVKAIGSMNGLSDQLRGACMSLITSRSEPPPFYLPG